MTLNFSDPVKLRSTVGQVTEDSQILSLIKEYHQKRQDALRQMPAGDMPTAPINARSHYVGSRSCNLCHSEINDTWSNSRHAKAMSSLVAKSRESDPDCLSCHVTGLEDSRSSASMGWGKNGHPMAGVQCEACHGPGADHSRNPKRFEMLSVSENTCTRCHTKYTDPGFDYHQDIAIISHGRVNIGFNDQHRSLP